jgi:ubiquinone biosynthesis protein UbiJ
MFFRLMLLLLGQRINSLAENNPEFQEAIRRRVCVLQFETANQRVARHYVFTAGKTRSEGTTHQNPTLTFSFASGGVARNLILAMARRPRDKAIMVDAINQGKLRLQGDMSLLPWFMQIADYFAPDRAFTSALKKGKGGADIPVMNNNRAQSRLG